MRRAKSPTTASGTPTANLSAPWGLPSPTPARPDPPSPRCPPATPAPDSPAAEGSPTPNPGRTEAPPATLPLAHALPPVFPVAAARIKAIASDIATKKVTDPIRVFGFTDNLGSSAHGAVLSKQ